MNMPQTDHDRSLVEHLVTAVMGWRAHSISPNCLWYAPKACKAYRRDSWNPLDPSAATWQVWEAARAKGIHIILDGDPLQWEAEVYPDNGIECSVSASITSGPRAICRAVGLATGWREPKGERATGR